MNDLMLSFKRIIKNRNTVTVIGVILILILLYVGYSYQINKATHFESVPVAVQNIQPRTLITDDMIEMIQVPSITISNNVVRSRSAIVGKYSNVNALIPEGSMFYNNTVIDARELPDAAFVDLKKGEIAFSFPVDINSTYGNAIMPSNKIDIYMKYGNSNEMSEEKVTIGKLINNVEVLAVKDSSGKAVFEDTENERTPSTIIFGLKEKTWLLLKKAQYLSDIGVELFPVPHSTVVSTDGAAEVSVKELEDYINNHATDYPSSINDSDVVDALLPTFSGNTDSLPSTLKITYPEGCDSKYNCTYVKDNGTSISVKKTSASVKFNKAGTLVATVTEKDGTIHTANISIPVTTTNSTNTNSTTNAGLAG